MRYQQFGPVLLVFMSLLFLSTAYLEMKLVRVPHSTKVFNYMKTQCLSEMPKEKTSDNHQKKSEDDNSDDDEVEDDDDDDQKVNSDYDFKQICYQKDISYAIQLYNKNNELLLFSIDMTAPISWMKGDVCHIGQSHKNCTRLEVNFKDQVKEIQKKIKDLMKNPFRKKPKKRKDNQYALIQGSSQVVKGILQKTQDLIFQTKDSGRLTHLTDVILLGLAIIGEKDILNLHNTTFIKATEISPNLNYLCDGAISLRFDENSQSSFLTQVARISQTSQKYVTIFVGEHNQSISIGDLTVKNSAQGLSGIHWIEVEQHQRYGKLPTLKQIWVTVPDSESHKQIRSNKSIVLTLSSSSISIPSEQLQKIIGYLLKKSTSSKKCSVNQQSQYVQCYNLTSSELSQLTNKQINFVTKQNPITISIKDLLIQSSKKKTVINIKQSTDSDFIILGQPIFKKYLIVLDYSNNRIGISNQRKKFVDKIIDIVVLIRFAMWIFIFGCCCVLMINPIDSCWRILKNRTNGKRLRGSSKQSARLKQYKRVQENLYDQLQGKIQQIVGEQFQAQQVQGI